MSAKRKRVVVSMSTRLEALKRMDNGDPISKICAEFNVGKSTVSDWRNNRRSIEEYCSKMDSPDTLSSRCTRKKASCEVVDEAMWIWYVQERRRGTLLTGPIIKEKARAIHQKIENAGEFIASEGWLTRWKKRHGINFSLNVTEEKVFDSAPDFKTEFAHLVESEELNPEQVFSMDQTELYFKMLPETNFLSNESKASVRKRGERITVAVCANTAGTSRIPLFVIGKSNKPQAFRNINPSSLPVYYRSQKSSWMTADLLKEWFDSEFVPHVKKYLKSVNLPLKAVLLLSNTPNYTERLTCDSADIRVVHIPPNAKYISQSPDKELIDVLKKSYRHKLVWEISQRSESENKSILDIARDINIKDVVYMLATAFQELPSSTFLKSWRWSDIEEICDDNTEKEYLQVTPLIDLQSCNEAMQSEEVVSWITNGDDDDVDNEVLNDDEIITLAIKETEEDNNDEESGDVAEEEKISHHDARNAMELVLKYIEQQSEATALDVLIMKKWRDHALRNSLKVRKRKIDMEFIKVENCF